MSRLSLPRSVVAGAVACALAMLVRAPGACAQEGGPGISSGEASPWSFQVVPFLWLPEVEGSVSTRGITADVDVDFGDVFDLLGDGDLFAAGGHFEARYDGFSFFVDAFGGTARPASDVTLGPRQMLSGTADLTLSFTFVEFGPALRVLDWPRGGEGRPVTADLLTGGRFMYFYQSISLRGAGGRFVRDAKATSTWVDPFVGGRFAVPLVGELDLVFRGDIGGFGAGSQLAWNLIGGFQYRLPWQPWGARTSVVAVYKALDFDYESGSSDRIDIALDLRGPAVGLAFEF
ncbi:MAG: hypothetical protein AB1689_09365 [Thermodesulfobacteriota bacterium]